MVKPPLWTFVLRALAPGAGNARHPGLARLRAILAHRLAGWPAAAMLGILSGGVPAWAADIDLAVDPDPPTASESFRLTFSVAGAADAEPDFSPLENVVEILGNNHQTSVQIINGRKTRTETWSFDVMARHAGKLVIPAIAFGADYSTPREIDIGATPAPGAGAGDDTRLLLEAEAEPRTPYVQQQVIYTVRVLHRVELSNATLSDPRTTSDAIVKPLGQAKRYRVTRHGRRYEVHEQKFAIFAQTSGALTIEPMTLTGNVMLGRRSLFEPFGHTLTTVRIQSPAVDLQVRPIPGTFTGRVWLPAKGLRVHEEWEPEDPSGKVGAPLARTLFLWADGLTAGQLPEIPATAPGGIKAYPDQPQTSEDESGKSLTALRQEKFAMIPNTPGMLDFPAVEIPWWNTETDREEIARLPARQVQVTAAAGDVSTPAPDPAPPPAPGAAVPAGGSTPATTAPAQAPRPHDPWFWVAAALLAAWLATIAAWVLQRRVRKHPPAAPPAGGTDRSSAPARLRRDLRTACNANNPRAAARALLALAATRAGGHPPVTLGALAANVEPPLAEELRALHAALYAKTASSWTGGVRLWAAFEPSGLGGTPQAAPGADPLEPLFRLARK